MQNQCVRIISGRWRGRKIHFPKIKGVRPTPDRVRETVFNWLQGDVPGARCLDAYAGSGALGFEALSRGASHVTFLDRSVPVIEKLKEHCTALEISDSQANISYANTVKWLARPADAPFDLVFLDPPFCQHLLQPTLNTLKNYGWLKAGTKLYIEYEVDLLLPGILPEGLTCLKMEQAGEVGYALVIND